MYVTISYVVLLTCRVLVRKQARSKYGAKRPKVSLYQSLNECIKTINLVIGYCFLPMGGKRAAAAAGRNFLRM